MITSSAYTPLALLLLSSVLCKEVRVGVLVPITGSFQVGNSIRPVIKAAFDDVQKDPSLLPGWNLTYTIHNSSCDSVQAVGIAADLMRSPTPVHAYIGPGCSVACLAAGLLAQYWNKAIVSFSCSSSDLEDRKKYSTFARTQPFSRTYSRSTPSILLQVMVKFKWKRAAILARDDTPSSIWAPIAIDVHGYFHKNNITVSYFKLYKTLTDVEAQRKDTEKILTETKERARGNPVNKLV